LARALVNQPRVLLLDEPMGALDAKIRKTMQVELKRIQREVGITFLYVTHDQDEAMALGDRIAVMHAGKYEDLGAPQRVYDEPATQFVAEFLGACNLLAVTSERGELRLPDGAAVGCRPGSMANKLDEIAQVGVRPEKMLLRRAGAAPATPGAASNTVSATITTTIYLGATSEYELVTTWGGPLHILAQNISEADRFVPGDEVTVSWEHDHGFALPASPHAVPVAAARAEESEV
jgi:ABC-type Fe3+/spermidine/putrescine transport system ATPase subunit